MSIKPPKQLELTNDASAEWKMFKKQFEWYSIATELDKKEAEIKVATFMAIIGPEAAKIYDTFELTATEQKDLKEIIKKFDNYFVPKVNISYERYIFNRLKQENGETFDEFLTKAKTQAKKCEYGDMNDSLIKDKIILGVNSDIVREKLLTEPDIDLQKAVNICRLSEQATQQLNEIHKNSKETASVDALHKASKKVNKENKNNNEMGDKIYFCKRCEHGKKSCPAFKMACEKCGIKGHFAHRCQTKK